MAVTTTGLITFPKWNSSFGGMYRLFLRWTLEQQDEQACSSVITMDCWAEADDPLIEYYPAEIRDFNVLITDYTGEHSVWYRNNISVPSGAGTPNFTLFGDEHTEIVHLYDGTGNFSIYVECTPIGESGDKRVGQAFQLPTIDVLSSCSVSSPAYIGSNVQVSVNTRNGFAYKHDVYATVGGTDILIASNVSAGTFLWNTATQASTIYATIPNTSQATIPVKCVTKYASTTIGNTTENCILEADPVASAPQITGASYQDSNPTTVAITTDATKIIRSHSVLQMLATSMSARYSATLVRANIEINGVVTQDTSMAGQSSVANWTNTIGTLNISNDFTATITLYDSRGNTTQAVLNVSVINYENPKANTTCRRVDNYYSDTEVTCTATFSSINGHNVGTVAVTYKKTTDSTYPTPTIINSGQTYTYTMDNRYRWNVKFILDDLLETVEIVQTVDIGMPLVFFDHIRSSFGVNCFPTRNNSIESEGLQIDNDICVAQATLSASEITFTSGTQDICYATGYDLIAGLFDGITVPTAYTKKYKITAQVSTSGTNTGKVTIGGISTSAKSTNGNSRKIVTSALFSQSDLTQQTTPDGQGLILRGENTGTGTVHIYNVCIACYLTK